MLPAYTRQNVEVRVPEVRELTYEQAARMIEGRRLRPERRDQPFNPAFPRGAVLDQNPGANAGVKPGRRIYLYVNSGTERNVIVPEVRTLTESVARAELSEYGLGQIEVRLDDRPSPFPGTVTRQEPSAGTTMRASETVTLWVSSGLGDGVVTVPDVRGLSHEQATRRLTEAGLWVDPTRAVSGTITRQEPAAGAGVQRGAEVRLSSVPVEEDDDDRHDADMYPEYPEGIPDDGTMPGTAVEPGDESRDAGRTDW